MTTAVPNVDPNEIRKFEELAYRWWDTESEFKPLHDINPLGPSSRHYNKEIFGHMAARIGATSPNRLLKYRPPTPALSEFQRFG